MHVANFHPNKARYAPGDEIVLSAELHNRSEEAFQGPLTLRISHLGKELLRRTRDMLLQPGEVRTETFSFPAPKPDFRGYLATIRAGPGLPASTAIDVSSTATRFPRYGYVSEFSLAKSAREKDGIRRLAQEFHINMLQFYDWFWRHEKLIKRTDGAIAEAWPDLLGRIIIWPVVLDLVETAQEHNVLAMAYVMSYAAREGYAELWPVSPAWGLFETPDAENQLNVDFDQERYLFLFNPGDQGWMDWIIDQYVEAINQGGFDGLHIDQFGPRHDVYGGDGQPIDLPNTFVAFLGTVKQRLLANDSDNAVCAFNLVDGEVAGWAVREVASAHNCDFLFSELWSETDTYDDLLKYIEYLRSRSGNRSVVLAGYSNYDEKIGPIQEAEGAAVLEGVSTAADHAGFTGRGFVDGFDEVGDSIAWRIQGPEDTSHVTFVIRFANATGKPATRNIYLDGRLIGQLRFSAMDQWSSWGSDAWVQKVVPPGSHTLRIAYDKDNIGAVNIDHLQFGEFDEDTVRLQNAVMFASGATHIQLGDDIQALVHEYYPNRSKSLTTSLRRALRRSYDFITAYENLLFDPDLVLLGHAGDSLRVTTGQPLQSTEKGRIFTIRRRKPGYEILHLVNLMGADNEQWRDAAPTPDFQDNIGLRYYAENPEEIGAIWLASPDYGTGEVERLEFFSGRDGTGEYIEFRVPRLEYWGMIVLERGASAGNGQVEATPPEGSASE
ncbi:MAG: glycoside hydrolase family 66 protein [Desulfocurvibacter africanus]